MRKLTKILISLLLMVLFIGCCHQRHISNNSDVLGASMKYDLVIKNASSYQVDSLIKADTLPNLEKWIGNTFIDYNSNERIIKRMYVKQNNGEIVYVITGVKEPFNIEKRITR